MCVGSRAEPEQNLLAAPDWTGQEPGPHTPLNVCSLHQLVPATFLKAQSFYFVNRKCVVVRFLPPFSPAASPRDLNSIYLNPFHVSFLMKTDQIHPVRSIPSSAPSGLRSCDRGAWLRVFRHPGEPAQTF